MHLRASCYQLTRKLSGLDCPLNTSVHEVFPPNVNVYPYGDA